MDRRFTTRDLVVEDDDNDGGFAVMVGEGEIPRFSGRGEEGEEEVVVSMHAWKGERVLGSWEVGRL